MRGRETNDFFFLGGGLPYSQAQKAVYSILRKGRKLGLPVDVQLHLFDLLCHQSCYMGLKYGDMKILILLRSYS